MKYKQFIRFVVNDNGNGKIKAMNKIVKVYDDEDKFIKIESPYIYATGTQIDIDMEETDSSKFMPLRHLKHKDGEIIKKTQTEIDEIDAVCQQLKAESRLEIEERNQEIEDAKELVADESKSDKQRLEAISTLIRLKGI